MGGDDDDDFGFMFMYWISYFLLDAFYGIRTKLLVTHTKMFAIWLTMFERKHILYLTSFGSIVMMAR